MSVCLKVSFSFLLKLNAGLLGEGDQASRPKNTRFVRCRMCYFSRNVQMMSRKKEKSGRLSIQKANLFINFLEKMTTHALFLFDWHFSSVTSVFNLSDDMLEITSTIHGRSFSCKWLQEKCVNRIVSSYARSDVGTQYDV